MLGFRLKESIFSGCHHAPYAQPPDAPYAIALQLRTPPLRIVGLKTAERDSTTVRSAHRVFMCFVFI